MNKFKAALNRGCKVVLLLTFLLILVAALVTINLVNESLSDLPNWQQQRFEQLASSSSVYDDQGRVLTRLRGKIYRLPVKLEQVSQVMQDAMVAIEDERFYDHKGIDYLGLARALLTDLKGGNTQEGASTITQQLVKNVLLSPEKKLSRKIKEAYIARQIERTYNKRQILELYLNYIYFGEGAYGIEAASQVYFGKPAADLNLAESALLAGLPKNPSRFSPLTHPEDAKNRRSTVLHVLSRNGYISETEAQVAASAALPVKRFYPQNDYPYPYFLDHVISELIQRYGFSEEQVYDGGLNIFTTLDQSVQQRIQEVYSDPQNFPPGSGGQDPESAMVVLEQSSGRIKGLIGGRQYLSRRGYNRATMLRRQPGSTVKPLVVYAPAIEKGYGPATVLDSSVQSYGSSGNAYTPENMGGVAYGNISMRKALCKSVNTYAVKLLKLIGVDEGYTCGRRLGLSSLVAEDKSLGLALGGVTRGLSPLELAGAYAPLANRGKKVEPYVVARVTDAQGRTLLQVQPQPEQVIKQETADMITDLLVSAVNDGTGTLAKLPDRPTAGKTGTTELPFTAKHQTGNKDAWFAGYTPELVGVVWLGYDITDPGHYLYKVYGGSYPAMIWHKVFSKITAGTPGGVFAPPPDTLIAAEQRLNALEEASSAQAPAGENPSPSQGQQDNSVATDPPGGETPSPRNDLLQKFISLFR